MKHGQYPSAESGAVCDPIVVKRWRGSPPRPRQVQHEHQDLGDRLVELLRNLVAKLDIGERAGEHLVLLDWDVVRLRDLDDLGAGRALALGDDAGRALTLVVLERDGDLGLVGGLDLDAHSARSRKWPALGGITAGGAPSCTTRSPGDSSARLSAWLRSE